MSTEPHLISTLSLNNGEEEGRSVPPEPNRFYHVITAGNNLVLSEWKIGLRRLRHIKDTKLHVPLKEGWEELEEYELTVTSNSITKRDEEGEGDSDYSSSLPLPSGTWNYKIERNQFILRNAQVTVDNCSWSEFSVFHLYSMLCRLMALRQGNGKRNDVPESLKVEPNCLLENPKFQIKVLPKDDIEYKFSNGAAGRYRILEPSFPNPHSHPSAAFTMSAEQLDWLLKNMMRSKQFVRRFLTTFRGPKVHKDGKNGLKMLVVVNYALPAFIDKLGGMISNSHVSTKCELETALSWLSTLGGAFSALGDISQNYAEEAAQISLKQLKIAWKLEDPLIQSRCRIYMAISWVQRGCLRDAKRMIKREYNYAMSLPQGLDPRLRRMCCGVWAKLQHAWVLRIIRNQRNGNSVT